jgi:hypothetical protein
LVCLGYHLFPFHVRLLQKSKQRFIKKLRKVEEAHCTESWPESKCARRARPLIAFTAHADAKALRKSILLRLQGQSP